MPLVDSAPVDVIESDCPGPPGDSFNEFRLKAEAEAIDPLPTSIAFAVGDETAGNATDATGAMPLAPYVAKSVPFTVAHPMSLLAPRLERESNPFCRNGVKPT